MVGELTCHCDWLLFIDAGASRGGGSNANDVGDLQLLSQQLTASQSQPHLRDALPAIIVYTATLT